MRYAFSYFCWVVELGVLLESLDDLTCHTYIYIYMYICAKAVHHRLRQHLNDSQQQERLRR